MSTLIYADTAGCWSHVAAGIVRLGRNALVVRNVLDAIVRLEDTAITIDAAFVSSQDAKAEIDIATFFELLKDEYPHVRRIAFAQPDSIADSPAAAPACSHEMLLLNQSGSGDFAEILDNALDYAPSGL